MTIREAIAAVEACETEKGAYGLSITFRNNAIISAWKAGEYSRRRWLEMIEIAEKKAKQLNAEWWADWQADHPQNEALGK